MNQLRKLLVVYLLRSIFSEMVANKVAVKVERYEPV